MRIQQTEVRVLVLINHAILATLITITLAITSLNIAEQLAPRFIHLPKQPQSGCNGHPEFCNRTYSNITQIATHDSAFVGILPMDNQNVHVTAQLDAGIRFLQAQTHMDAQGELSLCHTLCGMKDAGTLRAYLEVVNSWLEAHPQEVVTLLLTNGDFVPISTFEAAFNASGIDAFAYIPFPTHDPAVLNKWPTLAELIAQNNRLIAFLDYGAETQTVPYILPEFDYFWETPFDTTDAAFDECSISRPPHLATELDVASQKMYIVNHFLDTQIMGVDIPDRRDVDRTNARSGEGSLGAQVERCQSLWGRPPKGLLVDFFEKGDVFAVQDFWNGVGGV